MLQRFDPTNPTTPGAVGLANALMRHGSIADMRAAGPLPTNAQELIDQAVVRVGLERLVVAGDLLAEGLTFPLSDPLSVLEVAWEKESKAGYAVRTMTPGSQGENQLSTRTQVRVPIYATIDDFSLNIRTLRAAARSGAPLDTSLVEQATRRVQEAIEDSTINGAGTIGGNLVRGLLNAPNVNTLTYAGSEAWDAAGKTGEEILTDVLDMVDLAQADNRYGPYNLYVETTYGNALNKDFKSNSDKTTRQRLEELEFGGRNLRVRVADQLPDDRVALVQMTSDVIDLVDGQRPTVVSWTDGAGWNVSFAVIAFQVPRVKDDDASASGIVTGNV